MISQRPHGRALAAALAALGLAACAGTVREQPSAEQLDTSAVRAQEEYVIGPRDVLRISVWREDALTLPEVEVRLDGKISMPLLDDVQAAGLTPLQLKHDLTERLKDYVAAPQLTVVVTTRNRNPATTQSMKTCFVTEKSMPAMVGRCSSGWSRLLFATCSMITCPASNPSEAASAACSCSCASSWAI